MKFLCVSCDEPMKLLRMAPPDRGSMTVVYRCPSCEHQMAMLTNPSETEMVGSLGVKIGGKLVSASAGVSGGASKCPFSGAVKNLQGADGEPSSAEKSSGISWTDEALKRLRNIPEFVRPMAKQGIEKMARDQNYTQVDEKVLEEAKEFFGM